MREHGQVLEQDKKSSSTLQELEKSIAEMQTSLDEMRKTRVSSEVSIVGDVVDHS